MKRTLLALLLAAAPACTSGGGAGADLSSTLADGGSRDGAPATPAPDGGMTAGGGSDGAMTGGGGDGAMAGGGGDGAMTGGGGDGAMTGGGDAFQPPMGSDDPLVHAPPTPLAVTTLTGAGSVLDVGADVGGGVWAVSPSTVYYWPSTSGGPYTYTQVGNGLARGSAQNPFAAVAGTVAGEAIVGNRGAIGDHLVVNPSTGAVVKVENMAVPYFNAPEYQEHLKRVVAGIRVVADVDGVFAGTAYLGGTHGTTAWHGLTGSCGCAQFQEHIHYMPPDCDSTGPMGGCWGGDVQGLAFAPNGDLWIGDEHFVALLPQKSRGPKTDFFQPYMTAFDVFPKVNDEVRALSVDAAGGVWVASYGQGLAYLAPMTYQPSYFDRAHDLPQNRLTAVAVDVDGSVWVGTVGGGVARRQGGKWTYHTAASGLPANEVTSIYVDARSKPRRVLIGTSQGVAVYTGQ